MSQKHTQATENKSRNLLQITTNSRNFMSKQDLEKLTTNLNVKEKSYCLLQSFETKQQFATQVKKFLEAQKSDGQNRFLMIQCDFNLKNGKEIETARHTIVEQIKETPILRNSFILLFINLTRENQNILMVFKSDIGRVIILMSLMKLLIICHHLIY